MSRFPELNKLRGQLLEIHGSADSGKTKAVIDYLRKEQKDNDVLVYYIDAGNQLKNKDLLDKDKTWFSFDIKTAENYFCLLKIAKNVDVVVIDDITFIADIWKSLNSLKEIAQKSGAVIILINQMRFVLNHLTGEFNEQPYRINAIERYCPYIYDMDTETMHNDCSLPQEDDFVKYLLNMSQA